MAILTRAGRAAIAAAIKAQALHLAWGSGNTAWGDAAPPAEDADATALIAEIGRRTVTSADFVVPDTNGTIEVAGVGKFSTTTTQTRNLFVRTVFDFADAPSAVVREIGLFIGTTLQAGLPAGQRYFTPAQIASPGTLLHLEHRLPIYRSAGTRQVFEILLTI